MKAYAGVDISIHIFLISALAGDEWSASRPCPFTSSTQWIGGWMDSRAGLEDVEKKNLHHTWTRTPNPRLSTS
jgi:hypothetical protein